MGGAAEYYTKDEMAAFSKPKRCVKKKLRKKAAAADDEDTAVTLLQTVYIQLTNTDRSIFAYDGSLLKMAPHVRQYSKTKCSGAGGHGSGGWQVMQ